MGIWGEGVYAGPVSSSACPSSALIALALAACVEEAPEPSCVPETHSYTYGSQAEPGYGEAIASGSLRANDQEIDYEGGHARLSFWHQRDVDEAEDGCVAAVRIFVSNRDYACDLELKYTPYLSYAALKAGDACPGWAAEDEGTYTYHGTTGPSLDPGERVTGNVEEACFFGGVHTSGEVTVADDERSFVIDLSGLSFEGSIFSVDAESSENSCPFEE